MIFKLTGIAASTEPPAEAWEWVLEKAAGTPVARSPLTYESEEVARSAIAESKTALKGARFAKVEVVQSP